MKTVEDKGISHASSSADKISHRIVEKTALSRRTNVDGLAKKSAREIKSAADSEDFSVRKEKNPVNPAREKYRRKVGIKLDKKHKPVGAERTIQKRKTATNVPKKAVKRDLSRLHFNRNNPFKHKKFRLKKEKNKSAKPSGGVIAKGLTVPLHVAKRAVTKPAEMAGNKLLSQRINTSKTEDSGTESMKLGLQAVDYARRGVQTIKSAAQAPRKIYKGVKRTAGGTKRVVKTSAKAVRNAAKAARKAAKAAAKAAEKVAKITARVVKAAAQAVGKIVSLIAETAPYSLIVIAVIVVVLLLMYFINAIIGAAGSSVGGIGGWAANSDTSSERDVYDNIQNFISEIKSTLESDVQDELRSVTNNFCALWYHDPGCRTRRNPDGTTERYCDGHVKDNIIEFKSDEITVSYYPAHDGKSAVDEYIKDFKDQFDSKFYAEFLATLYVLKVRDMQNQNSSGASFALSDLEFTSDDFAELIKTVDENSCEYGDTYFYKTVERTTGKCPGENCSTEYRGDGCRTDSDGNRYCGGHPYCPGEHDKLIVKLYSTEKFQNRKPEEIYGFSDDEKEQFTAVKEFIKAISEDIEGGESSEAS